MDLAVVSIATHAPAMINFAFFFNKLLLWTVWVLTTFAIVMPNWSSSSYLRAGLWRLCSVNVYYYYWYLTTTCYNQIDPIKSSGFMVAADVLIVFGDVLVFFASCVACCATFRPSGLLAGALLCYEVLGFIFLMVGWGMWLGVHNTYYKQFGWTLDYSFWLLITACILLFLAICTTLVGMASHSQYKKWNNEKMVKDISFPGPPADGSAVHGVDGGYTTPITPTPSFDYEAAGAPKTVPEAVPTTGLSYPTYGGSVQKHPEDSRRSAHSPHSPHSPPSHSHRPIHSH